MSQEQRPTPPKALAFADFLRLFTVTERATILQTAKQDPVIEQYLLLLQAQGYARMDALDTQQGVMYLASKGLITELRAAEILGA